MLKQREITVALYLRLSRDDGGDAESNSIGNQREILRRYACDNRMILFDEYVEPRLPRRNEALNLTNQLVVDMQRLLSFPAIRARWLLDADAVDQF